MRPSEPENFAGKKRDGRNHAGRKSELESRAAEPTPHESLKICGANDAP